MGGPATAIFKAAFCRILLLPGQIRRRFAGAMREQAPKFNLRNFVDNPPKAVQPIRRQRISDPGHDGARTVLQFTTSLQQVDLSKIGAHTN